MKEQTLLELKNRVNNLTMFEQEAIQKIGQLEMVLSGVIKVVEKLDGYDAAKEALQKENEEILKEKQKELIKE